MNDPSAPTRDADAPFAGVAVTRGNRVSFVAAVVAAILVVGIAAMPWWAERDQLRLVTEFLYLLALAQMWNLLAGYGGLLSVGQQAFVGLGAYSLVTLGLHGGLNVFAIVPLAGIVGAVVAVAISPLLFRLRGAQFAVGTWVAAEVFRLVMANMPFVSGGSGVSIANAVRGMSIDWRDAMTLWVALVLGVGSMLGIYALLRSRHGLALVAVRDSERSSQSLGIDVRRVKLLVYVAAAAGCAMIGALIFVTKLRVSPDSAFSIEWSTTALFIVVIGGIGTLEGPLVGTIIFFALREWLSDLGSIYMIVLGILTMLVVLLAKDGLWGLVAKRVDLPIFPLRRKVRGLDGP
ncbi:MAG TPA: branched-chain amino acid ABC transporter permease [Burkholderiaceae bacterium]|nr:branched-chain amino acid ABC transporter permease [Burkholderiaceae bacterium]